MMSKEDDGIRPEQPADIEVPQVEATPTTGATVSDADHHVSLAYAGVIVSAMVLLVALTADFKSHKYYEYGISVGSIALILGVFGWIMANYTDDTVHIIKLNNFLLFAWCFIGACVLTFEEGPFGVTGNGYFGSWGLVVFSTMALGVNVANVRETGEVLGANGPLLGLFASAVILMIAISTYGIPDKNDKAEQYGEMVYSLILTILTILACGGILLSGDGAFGVANPARLFVMAAFSVMWITAACLLTFRGPFLETGNGYFGAWGGAVTSVFAANAARRAQQ